MLPKDIAKLVPKNRLMTEMEWRSIGIQQSQGWVHYMVHGPGITKVRNNSVIVLYFQNHTLSCLEDHQQSVHNSFFYMAKEIGPIPTAFPT